jgi:hypothetical protein
MISEDTIDTIVANYLIQNTCLKNKADGKVYTGIIIIEPKVKKVSEQDIQSFSSELLQTGCLEYTADIETYHQIQKNPELRGSGTHVPTYVLGIKNKKVFDDLAQRSVGNEKFEIATYDLSSSL